MVLESLVTSFKHSAARRCVCILFVTICVTASWSAIADWRSPYYVDHPLVGKIFSLELNDWVARHKLHAVIRNAHYLLLGETHTNPDHHVGQAALIHQWLDSAQPSIISMEMLSSGEWQYGDRRWSSLAELRESVKNTPGKWDWTLYDPLLKMAVQHSVPIRAANLNRQQRAHFAGSDDCQIERNGKKFRFCDSISAAAKSVIETLILDAHCGYLQAKHVSPLVKTQIAKDASFALSLYRAGIENKVVLIAGAVHVRKDIGVPRHLKRIGINSLSIAFIPVDPKRVTPAEYIDQKLGQPFDYIIFTPSERNVDPCVEFAEQLKKLKKPH